MKTVHQPVLLKTALKYLNVRPGEAYVDATLGGGGHAQAICQAGGRLFGLDQDPQAVNVARNRLENACPDGFWQLKRANFSDLNQVVKDWLENEFSGVLFDLGLSSDQIADQKRGFSFLKDRPLDMRMDPDLNITAADLLKVLRKGELNELFKNYGEEQHSLAIAEAICCARQVQPIETTRQLADLVTEVYGGRRFVHGRHPATKVFQALRISVNSELDNLKKALPQALNILKPAGRLVVISFHGLEDGLVKNFMRQQKKLGKLKILTKKPIQPDKTELDRNPRSRSAKLRAGEKL